MLSPWKHAARAAVQSWSHNDASAMMDTTVARVALRFFGSGIARGSAVVLATLVVAPDPASAQSVQEQIVGTYRLARYAAHGSEPIGRISYDSSGRMWAMLLPPGRAPINRDSPPEQYRDTMRGVVAYYGTYTIDESTQRVIHHVEAASNPDWIGDDFIRWYRFEGPNLLISLSQSFDNPLLWERLADRLPAAASAGATAR
jgi:hypothetical protein